MSIDSEDTAMTQLTPNSNRPGPWGLTLQNEPKIEKYPCRGIKFAGLSLLLAFNIFLVCMVTYLMSEINTVKERLRESEDSLNQKIISEVTHIQDKFKEFKTSTNQDLSTVSNRLNTEVTRQNSVSSDARINNGHLKIITNMQSGKISNLERKLEGLNDQINILILHNEHVEKALDENFEFKDKLQWRLQNYSNRVVTENINNKTFADLQNYVNGLVNSSTVLSMDSLLTYQNLTNSKLDALKVDIDRIQDEFTRISSVFDGWAMSEDEGKLYLDLKEEVDILRFAVTRKFDSTSNIFLDCIDDFQLTIIFYSIYTAPQTCYKYKTRGAVKSGSYDIDPDGHAGGDPFTVDCDFETGKITFYV